MGHQLRRLRFPQDAFGPLARLPLYFCWGCVSDLAYRLYPQPLVFPPEFDRPARSFQYTPYPKHFERRPLALEIGIPKEVRAILKKWNPRKDFFGKKLKANDRNVLADFFGHPVNVGMCLFHSQFGGEPTSRSWGEEPPRCPNTDCFSSTCAGTPAR